MINQDFPGPGSSPSQGVDGLGRDVQPPAEPATAAFIRFDLRDLQRLEAIHALYLSNPADSSIALGRFLDNLHARVDDAELRQSPEALIDRLGSLGDEILAELRHQRNQAGERISSATLKTSTRGVDLEVHSYDDGRLGAAVDDAICQYGRGLREIQRQQSQQWQETLDQVAK